MYLELVILAFLDSTFKTIGNLTEEFLLNSDRSCITGFSGEKNSPMESNLKIEQKPFSFYLKHKRNMFLRISWKKALKQYECKTPKLDTHQIHTSISVNIFLLFDFISGIRVSILKQLRGPAQSHLVASQHLFLGLLMHCCCLSLSALLFNNPSSQMVTHKLYLSNLNSAWNANLKVN